jgi:hypothetical protein
MDLNIPAFSAADTFVVPGFQFSVRIPSLEVLDVFLPPSLTGVIPQYYVSNPNATGSHISLKLDGITGYGLYLHALRLRMELFSARTSRGEAQLDFPNATGYHLSVKFSNISDLLEYLSLRMESRVW